MWHVLLSPVRGYLLNQDSTNIVNHPNYVRFSKTHLSKYAICPPLFHYRMSAEPGFYKQTPQLSTILNNES